MIGYFLFFVGFVLIFVAGWLNNTALMTMSFLLVLFSAAAFLATFFSLIFLQITAVKWTGRAERGLSGAVRVRLPERLSPTISHSIILKYRVTINGRKQKGKVRVPLQAGETIELPFAAEECGLLRVKVTSVWVSDLFGWFSLAKGSRIRVELPVFPGEEEAETGAMPVEGREDADGSRSAAAIRGTAVRDISAYRDGDEARTIHWPASARLGSLMKMEYEESVRPVVSYSPELPEKTAEVDGAACRISGDVLASLAAGFAVQTESALISSRTELDTYLKTLYFEVKKNAETKNENRHKHTKQVKNDGSSHDMKGTAMAEKGGAS